MRLNNPERAWRLWLIMRATDFHWTPDEIERQEEALLDDILTIAFAQGRIEEIERGKNKD